MKREEWLEKHSELFDERRATVFADAKCLPDGSHGLCVLSVKGNNLTVHDADFKSRVGDLILTIPPREVSDLKTSSFLFNSYLKFKYKDFSFVFADFKSKDFVETVKVEAGK